MYFDFNRHLHFRHFRWPQPHVFGFRMINLCLNFLYLCSFSLFLVVNERYVRMNNISGIPTKIQEMSKRQRTFRRLARLTLHYRTIKNEKFMIHTGRKQPINPKICRMAIPWAGTVVLEVCQAVLVLVTEEAME